MSYPSALFALMTYKSVTYAIFPNKPGVPLTEKNQVHVYIFWRRDLPTFFFLAHEYFTRFVCVVCFPRPSFKFRSEIFIRRAISEFIPPTTSPPSVSPLAPPPTGISNRRRRNHSFNHIYVLLGSSQVTHRSLSRPRPDCLNGACETSSCLQIRTARS